MSMPSVTAFDGTPLQAFQASPLRARNCTVGCDYAYQNFPSGDVDFGQQWWSTTGGESDWQHINGWYPASGTITLTRRITWKPNGGGNSGDVLFFDASSPNRMDYRTNVFQTDTQIVNGAGIPISWRGVRDIVLPEIYVGPRTDPNTDNGGPYLMGASVCTLAGITAGSGGWDGWSFRRGRYQIAWSLTFHAACNDIGSRTVTTPIPWAIGNWTYSRTGLFLPITVINRGYPESGEAVPKAVYFDCYPLSYPVKRASHIMRIPEERSNPETLWVGINEPYDAGQPYGWVANDPRWPGGDAGGTWSWCDSDIQIGVLNLDNILHYMTADEFWGSGGSYPTSVLSALPTQTEDTVLATQVFTITRLE